MSDRTEVAIVTVIMAAASLILLALLSDQEGAPHWSDAAMALAWGAGWCAFILVAVHVFYVATCHGDRQQGGEP